MKLSDIKKAKFFNHNEKTKLWNLSLRTKMIAIVLVMLITPLTIIGFYFFWVIHSILISNIITELNNNVSQTEAQINSQMNTINNTYLNLVNDESIFSNLKTLMDAKMKYNEASIDEVFNLFNIKSNIESRIRNFSYFNVAWNSKLLESIYLFIDKDTFFSYSYSGNKDINTFKDLYARVDKTGKAAILIPPSAEDKTIYYVTSFKKTSDYTYNGKFIFAINESKLSDTFKNILQYEGAQAMIFDDQGIVFSHSNKDMLGSKAADSFYKLKPTDNIREVEVDRSVYYVCMRKLDNKLTFLIAVPKEKVLSRLSSSFLNYLVITIIIGISFVIISIFVSSAVMSHINKLVKNMEAVQNGNYNARMPIYKENELARISNVFNRMTKEINHLVNEVYEKQLLLKDAELKSLQSQINPHFLFNTLVTIGLKAKISNNEDIYKMISSLSELLRAGIYSSPNDKISICQEMKYVEFYLYLQNMRFGNKIETLISHYSEEIGSYYIPKLCIQPIVENAIVHGLENKVEPGRLEIEIHEEVDSISFEIIDDGIGFDTNEVDFNGEINISHTKYNHTNIGLTNVNKRIKLLYGIQYGISIQSRINEGTKVIIKLPIDKGDFKNV